MARILLVDNDAGDRSTAARTLGVREQELERVDSVATALVRAAEAGHPFVLLSPATLEASAGGAALVERDLLRETFDVFEDGVCLLARERALKVANAIGERLFSSALKTDLEGVAERGDRPRRHRRSRPDLDGRAFAVRAYPLSERGGCFTFATPPTSASGRSAACNPRSSPRSACWRRASRTRSTTRRRSCWPTSRR